MEEQSSQKQIVIVLQDRSGNQVSAESATAVVASPDSACADASASGTGALRLKSGVSQTVTTSVAESANATGLVVDDARANAVVDSSDLSENAVQTASTGVAHLKLGTRPTVTSTSHSTGNRHQSFSGASRLKSGPDLTVPSAADVQQHLRITRGEVFCSENAEPRLRTSNGNLITTRTLPQEVDCHDCDPNRTSNEMECEEIDLEDGEVNEDLPTTNEIIQESKKHIAFIKDFTEELESKVIQEKAQKESVEDRLMREKVERQKLLNANWKNGSIRELKQFFSRKIEGKFTCMYSFRALEKSPLDDIKDCFPSFQHIKHSAIDNDLFQYYQCNENLFIKWRRMYLSQKPFIEIDTTNNKEAAFLSALIHLHSFNDCYMKKFSCPLSPWAMDWKESFCHFEDEVPECHRAFQSSKKLFDHCKEVSKQCRWHYLCFRFMEKVFFKPYELNKVFGSKNER